MQHFLTVTSICGRQTAFVSLALKMSPPLCDWLEPTNTPWVFVIISAFHSLIALNSTEDGGAVFEGYFDFCPHALTFLPPW